MSGNWVTHLDLLIQFVIINLMDLTMLSVVDG